MVSHRLTPNGGRTATSITIASVSLWLEVPDVNVSQFIQIGAPVTKEGVRGPSSSNLDDFWGNTRNEQFGSATNVKAMAGGVGVPKGVPDSVASS